MITLVLVFQYHTIFSDSNANITVGEWFLSGCGWAAPLIFASPWFLFPSYFCNHSCLPSYSTWMPSLCLSSYNGPSARQDEKKLRLHLEKEKTPWSWGTSSLGKSRQSKKSKFVLTPLEELKAALSTAKCSIAGLKEVLWAQHKAPKPCCVPQGSSRGPRQRSCAPKPLEHVAFYHKLFNSRIWNLSKVDGSVSAVVLWDSGGTMLW